MGDPRQLELWQAHRPGALAPCAAGRTPLESGPEVVARHCSTDAVAAEQDRLGNRVDAAGDTDPIESRTLAFASSRAFLTKRSRRGWNSATGGGRGTGRRNRSADRVTAEVEGEPAVGEVRVE